MSTDVRQERVPLAAAELRRGILAVVAGWAFPGLGHLVVGRVRRGIVFAVIILGSFALGLAHDGRLALRDSRQPFLSGLQVVANAGIGPLDLIARVKVYGSAAYSLPGDPTYPAHEERQEILRRRASTIYSLYGTAYLWTAGLMNLMLLFEVWDFATGRKE